MPVSIIGPMSNHTRTPFVLEDKELAPLDLEVKSTDDAPVAETETATEATVEDAGTAALEVVLIHHATIDGDPYLPGETVTVPFRIAQAWVASHRAAWPA